MDKKKIYLIIGGAVLAIALVIALVVGLGGNKAETPNGETTTPIVNESVGDNGGETTTPEGGETTTPDGTETTNPGGETTKPDENETEPEVTIPEIDVENVEEVKNLLNSDNATVNDDGVKSTFVEYEDYTLSVLMFPNNEIATHKKYKDGSVESFNYNNSGKVIVVSLVDKDGNLLSIKKDDVNEKYLLRVNGNSGNYEEYDNNGNIVAKATFKIVDNHYYILTKEIVGNYTVEVTYHESNPTVMAELVYNGNNYYHCKWNSSGNKNDNLTYYEYRSADGTYSKQSGTIDLFMLPSPPTNLTYDLIAF